MPFILGYTRSGDKNYFSGNKENYPGFSALNCDVNDAMHMAFSYDGKKFFPLRNNTGILFPKADFNSDAVGGITKTLIQPWLFRRKDGGFGVCAVRRNQNAPDSTNKGTILLYFSDDLVHYTGEQFLKADDMDICNPRCRFDAAKDKYYIEWENEQGIFCGYTYRFENITDMKHLKTTEFEGSGDFGIEGAIPGNVIEINDREGKIILTFLDRIVHTEVEIPALATKQGSPISFEMLPKALCKYSDCSVHEKEVLWSKENYQSIDFSKPGIYTISGEIVQEEYDFPFCEFNISDPYVFYYQDQYYLIVLDLKSEAGILASKSKTIEGLKNAPLSKILYDNKQSSACGNWWAPEVHIIDGIPYMFTTMGTTSWNTTRSCIYKCEGDIMNPEDWKGPYLVVKPDGKPLRPDGVSLDMTYFCINETHYVMWSDRKWADANQELEPAVQDTADTYIASVNPQKPWELISLPVCIQKPIYGFERYETKVEEGPFLLQHGDDLFVTISCSSTALSDLYCVGILHSNVHKNLLSADEWEFLPYPALTKESIPGEYGPGHNCFIKDIKNGNDLLIYHAVPHDECGKSMGRYMGIRRVHWAATGYPYLEMTGKEDLDPAKKNVKLMIEIL